MATLTKELNKEDLNKLDRKFIKYKVDNPNPNLLFGFYKVNKNLTVSVYKTGKVVFQGDQETIDDIFNIKKTVTKQTPKKIADNKNYDGTIGCDETGTGDYFGPIVTVACYLDNKNIDKVKNLGVKDSKQLSIEGIYKIYKKLIKLVDYEVCVCTPTIYNQMYKEGKNIKAIIAISHNYSLSNLVNKLKNKKYLIIMDQFVSLSTYEKYLKKFNRKIVNIDIIEPKAENKYLSVACASIIARATQLNQLTKYSKKIGLDIQRGATKKEEIAKIGKKIIDLKLNLNDFAKIDFESITSLINK